MVALVVGAGAVQNAWAPVLRALRPFFPFDLTADEANAFLARIIYVVRWYSTVQGTEAEDPAHLEELKELLRGLRQSIAAEVSAAERSGELRIRPEFGHIAEKFLVGSSPEVLVITTNWDCVVETVLAEHLKHRAKVKALHVHGSASKHSTVYLPTEVVREPYRTREEEQELGGTHTRIMHALEPMRSLLFYGVSLSPLDAELGQTLASGWDTTHLEHIDIVVPDHSVVAPRVRLLLSPAPVRTMGYSPDRLDEPVDYTIRLRDA